MDKAIYILLSLIIWNYNWSKNSNKDGSKIDEHISKFIILKKKQEYTQVNT